MAVAYGATGGLGYGLSNASATLPASIEAGDYLIFVIGSKPDTVTPGIPHGLLEGWTLLKFQAGGGGTTGNDAGPTSLAVFGRIADGTETGTPDSWINGNSVSWWSIYRFDNATGWWDVAADGGEDTTTGSAWSVTVGSDIGLEAGDMCFVASCIPTDVTTPNQFSNEAVAATGVTMGTAVEIDEADSGSGQDIGGFTFYQPVASGTSSAAATITADAGGTTTNVRGPSILVRLREATAPAITCVAKAGAEFLSTGTNKTTSSFTVAVDDVIVVAVCGDEPADTFGTITNSGTAFTWTLAQSRATGDAAVAPSYVWTTTATAAQSMTVNVVQTAGPTSSWWGISVQVFRGGTLGTSALGFGTASAPSVNMTCGANSAVSAWLVDENGTLFTSGNTITTVGEPPQTTHHQYDDGWMSELNWWHPDVGSSGSKTFGFSQGGMDWTLITVEIAASSGAIEAAPSAIASAEAFGTPTITATLTSSPSAIDTAEAFGTVSVSNPGPIITPTGITSLEAFGSPTISATLTASPSGIATAEAFGTPVVTATLTASPTAIGSAESFGTPTITATLTASPGEIATGEAFGVASVASVLSVAPTGITTGEAFGTVEVSTLYAVHPDPIATAEVFGTVTVDVPITAAPSGIASLEAFGTVEVSTVTASRPDSITSAEAFGSPTVTATLTASPGAIGSAESFGTVEVALSLTASPTGIASAEAFGSPTTTATLTASPSGIGTAEAFGTPAITNAYTVNPSGIASAEALGTVSITATLTASPTGIATGEAIGTPTVAAGYTALPSAISTGEAFGSPTISQVLLVSPAGITSDEALGQPDITLTLLVVVGGIATAEAFGTVLVSLDARHQVITTSLGVRNRYATGTPSGDGATNTPSGDNANLGTKNRSGTNTPRNRGAS